MQSNLKHPETYMSVYKKVELLLLGGQRPKQRNIRININVRTIRCCSFKKIIRHLFAQ